jgi:transcriptional antiterminator RfaH
MAHKWYVARTKALAEYTARDRLETAGCEVFLPCVGTVRPRRGHKDAPLFPGYLFLHYDLDQMGWQLLNQVTQLAGLVAFDGVAPPVPDEVIAELRERVEAINRSGGLWTRFHVGDRVHVTLGPLESLAEVVANAKSPRDRVRVLLEFLGQSVHAEVPWKDVRPTGVHDGVISAQSTKYKNGRRPRRTRGRGRYTKGFGPRPGGVLQVQRSRFNVERCCSPIST